MGQTTLQSLNAGLHRAVVQHEEMPARQRENSVDVVPPKNLDREPAAVRFHRPLVGRCGDRREESGEHVDPDHGVLELW